MKKGFSILLAVLFFLTTKGQTPADTRLAERAAALHDSKDFKAAVPLYEKLLLGAPKDPDYLAKAAYGYFHLEDYPKAKEKYRLALLYTPVTETDNRALYTSNLSACFAHMSDNEKAFDYANRAYQLKKTSFHLWNVLSTAWSLQKWDEILSLLQREPVDQNNNFLFFAGAAYNSTGKHAQAVEALETFLRNYNPEDEYPMANFFPETNRYLMQSYKELLAHPQSNSAVERESYLTGMVALFTRQTAELSREDIRRTFLVPFSICTREKLPDVICQRLFDASLPEQLPAEKAMAAYFVRHDYPAAYAATDELLQAGEQGPLTESLKITRYLAYLHLTLTDHFQNGHRLNEPMLSRLDALAQDYFQGKNSYSEKDLFDERTITIGLGTVQILNEFGKKFKKVQTLESTEKLVVRVFKSFPLDVQNSKGLSQILEGFKSEKP